MLSLRRQQNGLPIFLIMIDLDHFKQINDTHGHQAGDRILQQLARVMRAQSRPEDYCIRMGGEEFALLLQAPGEAEAMEVANRIRQEFAAEPTQHEGQTINHTLSAGLARLEPGEPRAALKAADAALYAAKEAGRNRVWR